MLYPSDLRDAEWQIIEPLLLDKPVGRPQEVRLVKGRKRCMSVDELGLMLGCCVTAAHVTDIKPHLLFGCSYWSSMSAVPKFWSIRATARIQAP
ncbi:hypothetical protein H6F89_33475 [Cyanobacteria bacterium FACHB-63]|nr:hypothetical protein [Cyanobacteria bacterium FACHB-63]